MRTGCSSCLLPPFSPGICSSHPIPSFPLFSFQSDGATTLYLSLLSPVHFWACLEATHALLGYSFPIGSTLFLYIFLHCSGNGRSWAPRTHQAISVFTFFNSSFQGAGSAFREVFSIEWKAWIWGPFCILKVDHHARWQSKIDQACCLVQAPRTYL